MQELQPEHFEFAGEREQGWLGEVNRRSWPPGLAAPPTSPRAAPSCDVLDHFEFDRDRVLPAHQPLILAIANRVIASQGTAAPIRSIRLTGHTDPVGDANYNLGLGRRRAEAVRRRLVETLERLRPGSGRAVAFDVQTRGEQEPIPGNDPASRRVVVCPIVPPARGCPPYRERIRLHIKILTRPRRFSIATMVQSMRAVYGPAGFLVEIASTETLNLPALDDLDIHCPGTINICCPFPCATAHLNPEHIALFRNRNNVGTNELVAYFVRSTDPALNGCCAHPPGQPGVVVTAIASQWSLGHEVGHVLGLAHVNNSNRLMFGGGTDNITKIPPDLVPSEIQTMTNSKLTIPC
jgi:hypothetical protein